MQIEPCDIGIITPYVRQVKAIRELFNEFDPQIAPKIGTVEEFQGQERQVIILSTVRSSHKQLGSDRTHSLGFVKSSKRMNVAISRARALLVIYGNPRLLSKDDNWSTLILKCIKNQCSSNCDPAIFNVKEKIDEDDE